jgi:TonB family protein
MRAARTATTKLPLRLALALACLLAAGTRSGPRAQQPRLRTGEPDSLARELSQARLLLWGRDTKAAVAALRELSSRHDGNPWVWHWLGVALRRDGAHEEASQVFRRALKSLDPSSTARAELAYALLLAGRQDEALKEGRRWLGDEAKGAGDHYVLGRVHLGTEHAPEDAGAKALAEAEAAISSDPNFAPAYLLKSEALMRVPARPAERDADARRQYEEAARSLEKFLTLAPGAEGAAAWREQLASLRAHAALLSEPAARRTVVTPKDVTTRAQVFSRPEPLYTEEARRTDTAGSVVVRVILADDGSVRHPLVVKSLPRGLSAKALEAARGIVFKPAARGGRPVSQHATIQYNFSIY